MNEIKNRSFAPNVSNLFRNQLFTDIEFVMKTKTNTEHRIGAHKNILSAASTVFERMFYGDFTSAGAIQIIDVSAEGFIEFLQFFYEPVVQLTEENIGEVLKLVDKYNYPGCIKTIERFLLHSAAKANALHYYELSLSFRLSRKLVKKCLEIVCQTENIFKMPNFLAASEPAVIQILNSNRWVCDEKVILEAAIDWAKQSLNADGQPDSMENMKEKLKAVIKCVRFPIMKSGQFLAFLDKYPDLLEREIYMDILNYITEKRPLTAGGEFKTQQRRLVTLRRSKRRECKTFGKVQPNRKVNTWIETDATR